MNNEVITLTGIGLTRNIFINDEFLWWDKGLKFDWGTNSAGSTSLASKILEKIDLNMSVEEFRILFIAALPDKNFKVKLHIGKLRNWLNKKAKIGDKARHPYSLISVIYKDIEFSKFLDLPNNDIKSAKFYHGTVEHEELSKFSDSELDTLRDYYENRTKTMDPNNHKEEINASLEFDKEQLVYNYINGIGKNSGFVGYNSNKYE